MTTLSLAQNRITGIPSDYTQKRESRMVPDSSMQPPQAEPPDDPYQLQPGFPTTVLNKGKWEELMLRLTTEFKPEIARLDGAPNAAAQVESVYTRAMGISGTPLRDSYHFGQTVVNDYGRSYWEGFNNITGLTADAEAGPVSFYLRGEYQHEPAMPS
jgi:hypothetical protein